MKSFDLIELISNKPTDVVREIFLGSRPVHVGRQSKYGRILLDPCPQIDIALVMVAVFETVVVNEL